MFLLSEIFVSRKCYRVRRTSQPNGKNLNRPNFKFKLLPLVLFGRIQIESTFRTWSRERDSRTLCACALLFTGMTTSDPRVTELFALYFPFHYSRIVEISCITKERPMNLPCVPSRLRITNSSSFDVFSSLSHTRNCKSLKYMLLKYDRMSKLNPREFHLLN